MTDSPLTDYTTLGTAEFYEACGVDASKWAAAFCQFAAKHGHDLDEGWMIGWFANAMMAMHDRVKGIKPVVLDDGSSFFVAEV